jgi:membrane-associated phospholipid phosphatase
MSTRIAGVLTLCTFLIISLVPAQVAGQERSTKPLFTKTDAWVAGGLTAASILLIQVDKPILRAVQRDSSPFKDRNADRLKYINEKSLLALDVVLYGVGRLGRMERVADIGLHGSEAIIIASAVSTVIKSTTGRPRPRTSGQDPFEFKPNKGWTDGAYRSFPSLHQAGSLAFASALVAETGHWWPKQKKWVAPAAYSVAILPGIARIYTDFHWTSDAVLGSVIGVYAGMKTVQYAHSHPGSRADRWLLGVQPGAAPMFVISRKF